MITKQKGSAILTTIFLLFGIFVVAMIGIDIIMSGLAARRAQGASTKAFYAAESGAERALSMYKLYGTSTLGILADSNCNIGSAISLNLIASSTPFCPGDDLNNYSLSGLLAGETEPKYWVKTTNASGAQIVSLNGRGNHSNTSRELYLNFCLPDCTGRLSGADDGCGGVCN